jgi:hypothetical protein
MLGIGITDRGREDDGFPGCLTMIGGGAPSVQNLRRPAGSALPHSAQVRGTGSSLSRAARRNAGSQAPLGARKAGRGGASGENRWLCSSNRAGTCCDTGIMRSSAVSTALPPAARPKACASQFATGSHAFCHSAAVWARWELSGCERRTSPSERLGEVAVCKDGGGEIREKPVVGERTGCLDGVESQR